MRRVRGRRLALTVLLYAGLQFGGAYTAYLHFDPKDPRGLSDALDYLQMYSGQTNQTKHRYRVLVPDLTRLVPTRAFAWLGHGIASRPAEFAFFLVNFLQMLLAVFLLHLILEHLGFAWEEAVIVGALFVTGAPAVVAAGTPMLDATTYLASVAMVWAVVKSKHWWVVIILVLATFAREPLVLLALIPLAARRPRWLWPAAAGVVAAGGWLVFKHWFDTAHPYTVMTSTFAEQARIQLRYLFQVRRTFGPAQLRDFVDTYIAIGPLALLGWRGRDGLPSYWRWMGLWIPFCVALGFATGNPGRISYMLLPVVAPYCAMGVRVLRGVPASPGTKEQAVA